MSKAARTYFTVRQSDRKEGIGVFREVAMPKGEKTRVMNSRVFKKALDSAGAKLGARMHGRKDSAVA